MNADSAWAALCEEHGAEHVWATAKDTLFELGFKAGARVAVVRPPEEVPEAVVTVRRLKARIAELEAAVVRPTRDQIAAVIHEARWGKFASDYDIVDALLKAFWPVAVSDSQETPTEGRDE